MKTKLRRWGLNLFPAYWGTGARLTYIADDFSEIRFRLPLTWRTRNYVGTIFGGSMYGAVDPIYMVMLIKLLGRDYVVWDKAAAIRFRRPGRAALHARFSLPPGEVESIKAELAGRRSVDRVYTVALVGEDGKVHAEVEKTLYIARRGRGQKGGGAAVPAPGAV